MTSKDIPPPTSEGMEPVAWSRAALVERICIGLFMDYDNLTMESAEYNWREGYAYGAIGSDGYREIMATANKIADAVQPLYASPSPQPDGAETTTEAKLRDTIEGLDADLFEAVEVAYRRGATEWVRLNYPKWIARLEANLITSPATPSPDRLTKALEEIAAADVFSAPRFAEDTDTDYFLRWIKSIKDLARQALSTGGA